MPPARKQRRRRNKASSRQGVRERDVPERKDAEAAARRGYAAARITRGVKSLCYQRESLIARRTDPKDGESLKRRLEKDLRSLLGGEASVDHQRDHEGGRAYRASPVAPRRASYGSPVLARAASPAPCSASSSSSSPELARKKRRRRRPRKNEGTQVCLSGPRYRKGAEPQRRRLLSSPASQDVAWVASPSTSRTAEGRPVAPHIDHREEKCVSESVKALQEAANLGRASFLAGTSKASVSGGFDRYQLEDEPRAHACKRRPAPSSPLERPNQPQDFQEG
ncbi:unnamed protein product, partial [Ixodes persulcatus]